MRIRTNDDDFDDCLEPCFSADFRKPVWRATIPWYLPFSPRYERLVAKLAEILRDTRPDRKVTAMFIDMAFGSPIYERPRALGFNNVYEVNFGLTHIPDRASRPTCERIWDRMKDWLLSGAIGTDERMATDLAGPGYHINRSNLLVLESKADMQSAARRVPTTGTRWRRPSRRRWCRQRRKKSATKTTRTVRRETGIV